MHEFGGKKFLKHLLCIVGFVFSFTANAQVVYDTIREKDTLFFSQEKAEVWISGLKNSPDTADFFLLDLFHRYKQFGHTQGFIHLGNVGSAAYLTTPSKRALTADYYLLPYTIYYNDDDNIYHSNVPFTSLLYTNGMKREQTFRLFHSQNITPLLNTTFQFGKINSPGFYSYQLTDHTSIDFQASYKTKTNRYGFIARYNLYQTKQQENGGLAYPEDFEESYTPQRELYETQLLDGLNDAISQTNRRDVSIKQFVRFIKKSGDDTISNHYAVTLSHTLSLQSSIRSYTDRSPNSGFYTQVWFDSLRTLDSLRVNPITNTFQLGFSATNHLLVYTKGGQAFWKHTQHTFVDTFFSNQFAGGGFYFNKGTIHAASDITYTLSGYNAGDINAYAHSRVRTKLGSTFLGFDYKQEELPFYIKKYTSNHYRWENDTYLKQKRVFGEIKHELNNRLLGIQAHIGYFENMLYYDAYAYPRQVLGGIQYYSASIYSHLSFWKIRFMPSIIYQTNSYTEVLPLPEIVSMNSIFYESKLFKSALQVQYGIDVFYFGEHYTYAYMPATGQYILQNERKNGNYPFVDFFLNLKIKQLKFFLKLEHMNAGLLSYSYDIVGGYPYYDRAVRIGLYWGFLR